MICPTCYRRCMVSPPGRERSALAQALVGIIPLRSYCCDDCDEVYTFAERAPRHAEIPDDTVWH